MSVDTYLLYARKAGVSRAEVEDLLDGDPGDIHWFADQCFSLWTGARFADYEQAAAERRLRLALQAISLELYERIEPFAVAYPDVAEYDDEDTLEVVLADPTSIRIDFKDFIPGDERFEQAEQDEQRQLFAAVEAMMALARYQQKDADFATDMAKLADAGQVEGLIARTRAVPELAPLVDILIAAQHFESYVTSAQLSRR